MPATTVQEFIAHAKANPGNRTTAPAAWGRRICLRTLFKAKAGIDVVYVPYKGSAQSITDLLGGVTQMTIDGLTGLYPLTRW